LDYSIVISAISLAIAGCTFILYFAEFREKRRTNFVMKITMGNVNDSGHLMSYNLHIIQPDKPIGNPSVYVGNVKLREAADEPEILPILKDQTGSFDLPMSLSKGNPMVVVKDGKKTVRKVRLNEILYSEYT
jgi:hypothetical protein